jgi:hypothetical protein
MDLLGYLSSHPCPMQVCWLETAPYNPGQGANFVRLGRHAILVVFLFA